MLGLFEEKEEIRVVDDQISAPTSAQFLAEKTAEILTQLKSKQQGEDRWGLYHLTENEKMSWYQFAQKILVTSSSTQRFKVKVIHPISTSEYLKPAKRPLNSCLDNEKVQSVFFRFCV